MQQAQGYNNLYPICAKAFTWPNKVTLPTGWGEETEQMTGILARWAQSELKTSKLLVNTDHSNSNFPSHPSQELRALRYGSERAAEVGCSSQGIPFAKSRLRLWLQARAQTHCWAPLRWHGAASLPGAACHTTHLDLQKSSAFGIKVPQP